MKALTALGALILGVPLILLMCVYGTFATGFCLAKLWLWYAVPLGLPAITWKVFGMLFQALYLLRPRQHTEIPKDKALGVVTGVFLAPWFALLIGWVLL